MADNAESSFQDSAVDMAAISEETAPEELPAKLEKLKASATKEYSLKNYDAAAEYFSEAAEVQDQINGEMSTENADLLYQYGRCLYKVAVANSDVLGGKVAGPPEPKRKKRKIAAPESSSANGEAGRSLISDAIKSSEQKLPEDVVEAAVEQKEDIKQQQPAQSSNPFFNISGDDNFTDSEDDDDDDADAEGEAEGEEDADDFAVAYEILDMARILLSRKIEELQNQAKGKSTEERPDIRQIKERLADTHDLQAEISLENERFTDAVKDTKDGLTLILELYPTESRLVTEAHYKLSLALEFASVTSTQEDAEGQSTVAQIDDEMRKEAAKEMELAIASSRARLAKEESKLSNLQGAEADAQKKEVTEAKEILSDLEQRLKDLRAPATSLSALQGLGPAGAPGSEEDAMRGILGSLLGESKADQAKRIEQATAQANDLSGMVKKKKPKPADSVIVEGSAKRKAEDEAASDGASATNGTKKVKISAMKPEVIGEQ